MSKNRFHVAATCIVLLVLAYYVWSAASNGAPLVTRIGSEEYFRSTWGAGDEIRPATSSQHYGYYNLMADSFLAGRLSLLLNPDPRLSLLSDPYDPVANAPYRLHDATLYKGHYYLYWGPVPALFLFIPFRILQLGKITEPFAVAIFGFGAFLFASLVLVHLARKFRPVVSDGLLLLSVLALGLSSAMPFVLRRPIVYEVAICAGAFFVMLGFFILIKGWRDRGPTRLGMVLVSLCWGMSAGCRVLYVFAGFALLAIWIIVLFKYNEKTVRSALFDGIALTLPFALCLLALGYYNLLRFDSWTEFGTSYNLQGNPHHPETVFRLGNLIPGLYFNVLRLPELNYDFPFFHLPAAGSTSLPPNYSVEPVAGLLSCSPIVLFLGAIWIRRKGPPVGVLITLVAAFGVGVLCFEALLVPGASMRYQVDFIFPILVAALLVWLSLDSIARAGWRRTVFRSVSVSLILIGIIIHLAFGCTGYYDLFKQSNPRVYFALEDFFSPVSRMLVRFSDRKSPKILEMFSPAGGGTTPYQTPFQWTGKDGLYLRFFSSTDATYRVMADFSLNRAGLTRAQTRLRFIAGKAYPVDVTISEDTHLEWIVPMRRGVYRLEFFAESVEQTATLDPRKIIRISSVRLVDAVTGQAVP